MKKQSLFPFTRMLLKTVPAESFGVSPKTLLRRREKPEDLTIGELKMIIRYETARGEAPAELIRKFIREDLSL